MFQRRAYTSIGLYGVVKRLCGAIRAGDLGFFFTQFLLVDINFEGSERLSRDDKGFLLDGLRDRGPFGGEAASFDGLMDRASSNAFNVGGLAYCVEFFLGHRAV